MMFKKSKANQKQLPADLQARMVLTPDILADLEAIDREQPHRKSTLKVLALMRSRSGSMSDVIGPVAEGAVKSRKIAGMVGNLLLDSTSCMSRHGREVIDEFATALAKDYPEVLQVRVSGHGTGIPIAHYASFYRPAAEMMFKVRAHMFDLAITSPGSDQDASSSDSLIVWLAEHESVLEMMARDNPILLYRPVHDMSTPEIVALAEALIEGRLDRLSKSNSSNVANVTKSISTIINVDRAFLDVVYERLTKASEDSETFERLSLSRGNKLSDNDRSNMEDLAKRARKIESGITEVLRRLNRKSTFP